MWEFCSQRFNTANLPSSGAAATVPRDGFVRHPLLHCCLTRLAAITSIYFLGSATVQTITSIAVWAILAAAAASPAGDAKKELDLLQGDWKVESAQESTGKNGSEDDIKALLVRFKGDNMKITLRGELVAEHKIKIDAAKSPKSIDLTPPEGPDKGKTEPGIYKIEGDRLTLCVNDAGKDRPAAFATKDGTKISLFVLKRAK
jgi:uncharacterized protein (TIGR03067 family)